MNKETEFLIRKYSEAMSKAVYCEEMLAALMELLVKKKILTMTEVGEMMAQFMKNHDKED